MIRYVITHRMKTQTNKKRNNVTEADFQYWWSNNVMATVFSKSKASEQAAGSYYYNSLAEAQQYVEERKREEDILYHGHRIWRVELLEEQQQDKAYQADTDKLKV